MPNRIVGVVSGGLDSVCFAVQYLDMFDVYPIMFRYGQKAGKELHVVDMLHNVLDEPNVFHKPLLIDLQNMAPLWSGNQLTDENVRVEETFRTSLVVPLRNAVFLTAATIYAFNIEARSVIYGAVKGDEMVDGTTICPDCSPDFMTALMEALNLGHAPIAGYDVKFHSPNEYGMTKADNLLAGYEVIGDLVYQTWSCFLNGERHCGVCEACRLRKLAFEEAGIIDRTGYEK